MQVDMTASDARQQDIQPAMGAATAPRQAKVAGFAWYTAAMVLSLLIAVYFLRVIDFQGQPFAWHGDYMIHMAFAKGTVDHGWYLNNPDLGAPFGLQTYDFPQPEATHYLILKFIGWLFPHASTPLNFFYLLSFPLAALTAMYLFRRYHLPPLLSLLGAMLFTLLPYHFERQGHVMLASYWPVPLGVLAAMMVAQGESIFVLPAKGWHFTLVQGQWGRKAAILAIAVLMGSTGAYYAMFACVFLAVAAMIGAVRRRSIAPAVDAGVAIALITLTVVLNVAPNLLFFAREGKNVAVADRDSAAAEIFGLKITQVVLPQPNNPVEPLAKIGKKMLNHPLQNENATASLGLVMTAGFLILLAVAAFSMLGVRYAPTLVSLSFLNLSGVLFATVGGFGAVFAILVSPQFRGFNRISVFLGLFSAMGLMWVLQRPYQWLKQRRAGGVIALLLAAAVLSGATYEMVPRINMSELPRQVKRYSQDQAFIAEIERILPPDAMVFQLPYMPFPENGPIAEMPDYDHLRLYLVSHHLRFSYGAMRGRTGDKWMQRIAAQPLEEMLESLALAGYQGLVVEKCGYPGRRAPIDAIAGLLRVAPVENARRDACFFDLRPTAARLEQRMTPEHFKLAREKLLTMPVRGSLRCNFIDGALQEEADVHRRWRWFRNAGVFEIVNPFDFSLRVQLHTGLEPGMLPGGKLVFSGAWNETIGLRGVMWLDRTLVLSPGVNTITFNYDGPALEVPADPRGPFLFRMMEFSIQEATSSDSALDVPTQTSPSTNP